jgi:hypothetical protein
MTFDFQRADIAARNEIGLQVVAMLERKRRIDSDKFTTNNMVSDDFWVSDAIELLLRIELMRSRPDDAKAQEWLAR